MIAGVNNNEGDAATFAGIRFVAANACNFESVAQPTWSDVRRMLHVCGVVVTFVVAFLSRLVLFECETLPTLRCFLHHRQPEEQQPYKIHARKM